MAIKDRPGGQPELWQNHHVQRPDRVQPVRGQLAGRHRGKEGRQSEGHEPTSSSRTCPGIYSLSPYTLEEVVARGYLVNEQPDAILNIVDATNIERNLYLTTQLAELGIPMVLALNMIDVTRKNGDIDRSEQAGRGAGLRSGGNLRPAGRGQPARWPGRPRSWRARAVTGEPPHVFAGQRGARAGAH